MDNLPESTNACPASSTTDIQPDLLDEAREFFAVECEKNGFVVQAAAVREGRISHRDGGQVCLDAMVAFARHHLTSTTPTLGDMVMVPREPTEAMLQGACEKHRPGRPMQETTPLPGREGDTEECPLFAKRRRIWSAMLSAAPASPIPTSVGNEGARNSGDLAERIRAAVTYQYMPMQVRRLLSEAAEALSPALDNTAVEEDAAEIASVVEAWRDAKRLGLRVLTFGMWKPSAIRRLSIEQGDQDGGEE
ncbi:hypothetical protein [Sphingomonas sp.]|uniref:hypothetical protein n=1 Tax=Sphingomonas sp. TaxID=28214 RepID=UPI0035C84DCE